MGNFINNIHIKNYKLFDDLNDGKGLELATPKGSKGSGLTLFIGENNSGKSSVFAALTKLADNSKIHIVEKKNKAKDTTIDIISEKGKTSLRSIGSSAGITNSNPKMKYEEIEFIKENRVWSSKFISEKDFSHEVYLRSSDQQRTATDSNLARRLANFKGGDENKNIEFNTLMKRIIINFEDWNITSYSVNAGDSIGYEVDEAFLEIDTALGSGLLNLFRIALALVDGKNIMFLDEPEAYLHPKAQERLCEALVESSKDKQIVYATHSPFMLKAAIESGAKVYLFDNGKPKELISDENVVSWNYVAWKAYGTNLIDLHTELFAKLYFDYDCTNIGDMNDEINDKAIHKKRNRASDKRQENYGKSSWKTEETLPVWVRNFVHHPELNQGGNEAEKLGYYRIEPSVSDIQESVEYLISELSK